MADIDAVLHTRRYGGPMHVRGRASIADLIRPKPAGTRCGLYVLHFEDGRYYCGQAKDVTRRYVQHRKVHPDIVKISFRRVPEDRLDAQECADVAALEAAGIRLRNVALVAVPAGESDFDLIMPTDEQQEWLRDPERVEESGERADDPALRERYARRYQQFAQSAHAAESIEVLECYVRTTIPVSKRSEMSFWYCSCMPSSPNPGITLYSRINVNWQTVFEVREAFGRLEFVWYLPREPLRRASGPLLWRLRRRYGWLSVLPSSLVQGDRKQVNIVVGGAEKAKQLLEDRKVLAAARRFNLRLMRMGPAANGHRYHCLDLADRLLMD